MTTSTLILNASYEPLAIVSARRAVKLVLSDKAISLDDSPARFRSEKADFAVAYVILLRQQVKRNSSARSAKFSKRGVLIRDSFTCVYCGKYGDTIDHIIPQSLGGGDSYDNCVTACKRCNNVVKQNKTLEQLGWKAPVIKPTPTVYEILMLKVRPDSPQFHAWKPYVEYYLPASKR